MKILELRAENFKRLKAVSIRPDGDPVVMITGKNAQGKTSALDAIWSALDGKASQAKPIRDGEEKAEILLDLGEYKVKRIFSAKGNYLTVTDATGKSKYSSPQSLVNKFLGDLSFDPLEFLRLDGKKQNEILKKLVKIEFLPIELEVLSETNRTKIQSGQSSPDPFLLLDLERRNSYDERTLINRELKNLMAQIESMPDVPETQRVDVAELIREKDTLESGFLKRQEWEIKKSAVETSLSAAREATSRLDSATGQLITDEDIKAIEEQIESIQKRLAEMRRAKSEYEIRQREKAEALKKIAESEKALAELLTIEPLKPDQEKLAELKLAINRSAEQNSQAEAYERKKLIFEQAKEKKETSDSLTDRIEKIDQIKRNMVARANMPIEGLEFGEEGIAYRGIPISQCSSAEALKVSCAIGMAVNPQLRVMLIRDGSLLDTANMQIIREMSEKHDFQIWMEKVDETGEIGFYIEDGEVFPSPGGVNG